jgi:hypothetical protein
VPITCEFGPSTLVVATIGAGTIDELFHDIDAAFALAADARETNRNETGT